LVWSDIAKAGGVRGVGGVSDRPAGALVSQTANASSVAVGLLAAQIG
jgi:hypothetical protein